jgi:cytochrome b561
MNKFALLKAVNILLFVSFALQALTGAAMALGIQGAFMPLFFEIHEYNGFLILVLAAAHLYLNWAWVKSAILKKPQPAAK